MTLKKATTTVRLDPAGDPQGRKSMQAPNQHNLLFRNPETGAIRSAVVRPGEFVERAAVHPRSIDRLVPVNADELPESVKVKVKTPEGETETVSRPPKIHRLPPGYEPWFPGDAA